MKKILLTIAFLLILAAIPLTLLLVKKRQEIRQKAAPATSIYLDPASISAKPDDTFTANVMIKTGENQVSAAELHLSFDSIYLEAQSIQNGTFLEYVLVEGVVESGSTSITLGSAPAAPKQTVGDVPAVLAVLTFKALAETSTPTKIEFLSTTQIAGVGEGATNVLIGIEPAEVTVSTTGGGASPSPSPSASPGGASPSPSPSATDKQTNIIAPANGSTTTNRRIPIAGDSFPNALIILSVNTVISTSFYADASGNWIYTPTADLANDTYTVTVTGESSTGVTETATSTFTVSSSTGGAGTASPTPTLTTVVKTSATPTATTSGTIPVTGTGTPTVFLLVMALLLITLGIGVSIFPRF